MFTIRISGNWCSGYFWELVSVRTGNTYHHSGPYHQRDGRKIAKEDAEAFAFRHDLSLFGDRP